MRHHFLLILYSGFVTLYFCTVTYTTHLCPECCSCGHEKREMRLHCSCIPDVIPNDTTHVTIQEYTVTLELVKFAHHSWTNVKSLHLNLHPSRPNLPLTTDSFLGVPDLEELRLSDFLHLAIPTGTFGHLHKLKVLDLSNNPMLILESLSSIFPDLKNLSLDLLNLSRTNRFDEDWQVSVLDRSYIAAFTKLRTKSLDISWTGYLYMDFTGFTNYEFLRFQYVEILNASHTTIVFSKPHQPFDFNPARWDLLFPVLHHLNIMGLIGRREYIRRSNGDCKKHLDMSSYSVHCASVRLADLIFLPRLLDSVNLDNMTIMKGSCLEQTSDYPFCFDANNTLRYVSLKFAGLTGWNGFYLTMNHINTLDLRNNMIRVITRVSLRCIPSLKRLLLGSNQLWWYQSNTSFESVLNYSTELQEIDLSTNNLSMIPRLLFAQNTKLQLIDLSDNKLTTLSIEMKHLSDLRILDLSQNSISTITESCLTNIRSFAITHRFRFIDLTNNSIICSCHSKRFIETLLDISGSLISFETYRCTHKDSVVNLTSIDEEILNQECILEILTIVMYVLCPVVSVFIAAIVLFKKRISLMKLYIIYRFWRYRKKMVNVEDRIFLAYSHHDKDLVFTHIYNELNSKLQQLLETDNDVLYINDKDFSLPGLIDEEIVTAVLSCKCTVALVSRRFLESSWTHLEVSYSWLKKRPVILVFLEDIRENELHGIMRYLYNKNVRLMWPGDVNNEDKDIFWTNLIQGLVKLLDSTRVRQ